MSAGKINIWRSICRFKTKTAVLNNQLRHYFENAHAFSSKVQDDLCLKSVINYKLE